MLGSMYSLLVLLATFCWQNDYYVSVLLCRNYLESSEYSEIISPIWKGPWYDNYQCHKFQEGNFWITRRFYAIYNSAKVGSSVDFSDGPVKHLDEHQCSRRFWTTHYRHYAIIQTIGQHSPDAIKCSRRFW
jgi:hypothetical protein